MDGIDTKKLQAREKRAVEQWFEKYADPLYTLVFYRVGGDVDTAQDIVQETFLTALDKIEDYEPRRGSMFAWLSYLSKNCIKKTLRDKNRSASYQSGDLGNTVLSDAYVRISTELLPEDIVERGETAELVRLALGSIPDDYRSVLRQYYYERSSVEEISKLRDLSAGGVRALLYRARAAFKEAFLHLVESPK